jgi:hypothetical protein
MKRLLPIPLAFLIISLQSCSYILYPIIRNYTDETVTFVMEIKDPDAHFYWKGSYFKDATALQGKFLPANNELYKMQLPDERRYSLDSTRLYLTLPPGSTTILSGFHHSFYQSHYIQHLNIYIARAKGAKQYLGTDIPIKAYGPTGKEKEFARPFSKDRVVFDVK